MASDAEEAVTTLLHYLGEDPTREGLVDTPKRVARALREMTDGYYANVDEILATTFDEDCDEMVVVTGIPFVSLCEHHMLPFVGRATVGYIPYEGRIVGLSKIPRLVDVFAHRLQVQERLTRQIADTFEKALDPLGVGVLISAQHSCLSCRGARKHDTLMVTSAMLGAFRSDPAVRHEFLSLAGG